MVLFYAKMAMNFQKKKLLIFSEIIEKYENCIKLLQNSQP